MAETETPEVPEVPQTPTPQVQEFWSRRGNAEKRKLALLRRRMGHKMTNKTREALKTEINRTEQTIRRFHDYETGKKIPPQPKEHTDVKETPRLIEIAYGPEPWRLMVNVYEIQALQFLPKIAKQPDGSMVYSGFLVTIIVAGRVHEFPFFRAIDAQGLYEYIKSELASVGITVRTLPPTQIIPPPIAANDEVNFDGLSEADRAKAASAELSDPDDHVA